MTGDLGPINAIIGIKTDDESIKTTVVIKDGKFSFIKDFL